MKNWTRTSGSLTPEPTPLQGSRASNKQLQLALSILSIADSSTRHRAARQDSHNRPMAKRKGKSMQEGWLHTRWFDDAVAHKTVAIVISAGMLIALSALLFFHHQQTVNIEVILEEME